MKYFEYWPHTNVWQIDVYGGMKKKIVDITISLDVNDQVYQMEINWQIVFSDEMHNQKWNWNRAVDYRKGKEL